MADVNVNGVREQSTGRVIAITPETWTLTGPGQSRWSSRHVYWVLPLVVIVLMILIFLAFFHHPGGIMSSKMNQVQPPQAQVAEEKTITHKKRVIEKEIVKERVIERVVEKAPVASTPKLVRKNPNPCVDDPNSEECRRYKIWVLRDP